MNEAGLAKRVLPCTRRGCGLSVVHHQSSCSRFLQSRVEKSPEASAGVGGKERY